jgi:hypothetical protein
MSSTAVYHFQPQVAGDTFEPRVMAIKRTVNNVLQDLDGATVVFYVTRPNSKRIWLQRNCSIIDKEECVIQVPEIKDLSLTPAMYVWYITITYSDGDVKTYIGGNFPVVSYPKNIEKCPIQ